MAKRVFLYIDVRQKHPDDPPSFGHVLVSATNDTEAYDRGFKALPRRYRAEGDPSRHLECGKPINDYVVDLGELFKEDVW